MCDEKSFDSVKNACENLVFTREGYMDDISTCRKAIDDLSTTCSKWTDDFKDYMQPAFCKLTAANALDMCQNDEQSCGFALDAISRECDCEAGDCNSNLTNSKHLQYVQNIRAQANGLRDCLNQYNETHKSCYFGHDFEQCCANIQAYFDRCPTVGYTDNGIHVKDFNVGAKKALADIGCR